MVIGDQNMRVVLHFVLVVLFWLASPLLPLVVVMALVVVPVLWLVVLVALLPWCRLWVCGCECICCAEHSSLGQALDELQLCPVDLGVTQGIWPSIVLSRELYLAY